MLAGDPLDLTLQDALVAPAAEFDNRWWSGSDVNGDLEREGRTCEGWTSSSAADVGRTGLTDRTNFEWIFRDDDILCGGTSPRTLLCACWRAG